MPEKPHNALAADAAAGDVRLREALAREQGRREAAERLAYSANRAPAGPPPEDPLKRYTSDASLSPEEQQATLDRAIRMRALGTAGAVAKDLMERQERGMFDLENRMAYDNMITAYPQMLEDEGTLAAAAGRAQYEFDKSGTPPAPGQFYRRVSEIWRAGRPQVDTPHIEGEGDPSLSVPAGGGNTRKGPNYYEDLYGIPGVGLIDGRAETMKKLLDDHIDGKNEVLEKKGIVGPSIAHLRLSQRRKREKEQVAASAA